MGNIRPGSFELSKEEIERLVELRKRSGLLQVELAKKTRTLSHSKIQWIEQGRRRVTLEELTEILSVHKLTPAHFFGGSVPERIRIQIEETTSHGAERRRRNRGRKKVSRIHLDPIPPPSPPPLSPLFLELLGLIGDFSYRELEQLVRDAKFIREFREEAAGNAN